jgi:diguanylate cyclase (GGDEF)-like protein
MRAVGSAPDNEEESDERTVVAKLDVLQRQAPAADKACLVIIHGNAIGKRIELGVAPVIVGRSARADIQLDEESVSRQHARIELDPSGGYRVFDLDSTNGTHVNDVARKQSPLQHGDQIQIGRSILKYLAGGHIESLYHEEVYRLMTTDALTRLVNRRAFEEALTQEISRAERHKHPLCVGILDIDKFKSINDTYGHLAGDSILRQVGTLLRGNVRRHDTAGRLGGEEFALLLPEINLDGGRTAAEKVRRVVEQNRFEFDGTHIPVTISIGVTERRLDAEDPKELIRRADEALYEAKRSGRNRVCVC